MQLNVFYYSNRPSLLTGRLCLAGRHYFAIIAANQNRVKKMGFDISDCINLVPRRANGTSQMCANEIKMLFSLQDATLQSIICQTGIAITGPGWLKEGVLVRTSVFQSDVTQRVQWIIRILCVLGIAVSGYLTLTHLSDTDPYCAGVHSCTDVQNSPYSEVFGVPVAAIGLAGYFLLLALSVLRGRISSEVDFYLPVLSFGAALIGVLYSLYLTYLEAYVILAWCYWCVTSAIIITAILALAIHDLRRAWVEG
jgi:uncharacterized membrane protein